MIYIAITKQINSDLLNEQLDTAYHGRPNAFWIGAGNDGGFFIQIPDSYDPKIAETVLSNHDSTAVSSKQTLRNQVLTIAQSASGVLLTDLTQLQIKALFAYVLWKLGGVTNDLKVKPLQNWEIR